MSKLIYFHVGTLKTGTTTIQKVMKDDPRIELSLHSRWYNTANYSKKPDRVFTNDTAEVWIESDENIARGIEEKIGLQKSLARIKKDFPEAHIVYTIRDQFSAINSMYKHFIRHTFSSMSLTEFLQSDYGKSYLETLYFDQVYETIAEEYDPSAIHFFDANSLFKHPERFIIGFYKELFGFEPVENFKMVFENKGFSSSDAAVKKWLNSFVLWKNEGIARTPELKVSEALTRKLAQFKKAPPLEKVENLPIYQELLGRFRKSNEFLRLKFGDNFLNSKYV